MSNVLIVIPTLNESTSIANVLGHLSRDLPKDFTFYFVVVDGGSNDGTQDIVDKIAATRSDLTLLHNDKRIQSAGVNLAVEQYGKTADFLIRCDAHAFYPPMFIAKLLQSINCHKADSIVVPMDSIGKNCLQKAIAWVSDTVIGSGGSAHRGGQLSGYVDHGHHALFKMPIFKKVGGYREDFSHNEDAEFDCRLRKFGGRIYLDSEIRLQYYPRESLTKLWRQYFNYGKGRSRTVRCHPDSLKLRQLLVPLHLALTLFCFLFAYVFPWLLVLPLLYVSTLTIVSMLLVIKHQSLCAFMSGLAAFTMHTSWSLGFYWGMLSVQETLWEKSESHALKGG